MTTEPSAVPTVTVADVAELTAQGWTVLDVRTDDEWAEGHLAGALHIPLADLPTRVEEVGDQTICMCAVGGRSSRATQWLVAQGRDVVNLDGGIQAWLAAGGAVEA